MKLLKDILAEAVDPRVKGLWYVHYQIVGRREDGTYMVNANTKKQAIDVVKAIDEDYARVSAEPMSTVLKDFGESLDEFVGKDGHIPKPGKYWHVEEGT